MQQDYVFSGSEPTSIFTNGLDMFKTDGNPQNPDSVSRLSEMVIEALKDISAKKLPLTSTTLSRALVHQKDFSRVSQEVWFFDDDSFEGFPIKRADLERLKNDIHNLQDQKNRLTRQLNEQEAIRAQDDRFFRRALMNMITLMLNSNDDSINFLLLQLRELLKADAELPVIKEFYSELKSKVLAQGVDELSHEMMEEGETWRRWGRFFQGKKSAGRQGRDETYRCRELTQMYRQVIAIVPPDLKFSGWQRMQALDKVLQNDPDLDQLLSLREEFVYVVRSYINALLDENKEVVGFLSEMGNDLAHIESILCTSLGDGRAHIEGNEDFGRMIEDHMDEIRSSLDTTISFGELKKLVAAKLSAIKAALEAKRVSDSMEIQKFKEKLGGLQEKFKTVRAEIDQVQQQAKKLKQEVLQDALTGANNRRAYEIKLQEEFQRYQRYGQVFSLLLFDVDQFKEVNDHYGHMAGDRCLKEIVESVQQVVRPSDFVARYGGDEFVVLLPGIGKEGVTAVGEKVRRVIEMLRFLYQGKHIPLSVSVGAAEAAPSDTSPDALFIRADSALFKAKQGGRNLVVVAENR